MPRGGVVSGSAGNGLGIEGVYGGFIEFNDGLWYECIN